MVDGIIPLQDTRISQSIEREPVDGNRVLLQTHNTEHRKIQLDVEIIEQPGLD